MIIIIIIIIMITTMVKIKIRVQTLVKTVKQKNQILNFTPNDNAINDDNSPKDNGENIEKVPELELDPSQLPDVLRMKSSSKSKEADIESLFNEENKNQNQSLEVDKKPQNKDRSASQHLKEKVCVRVYVGFVYLFFFCFCFGKRIQRSVGKFLRKVVKNPKENTDKFSIDDLKEMAQSRSEKLVETQEQQINQPSQQITIFFEDGACVTIDIDPDISADLMVIAALTTRGWADSISNFYRVCIEDIANVNETLVPLQDDSKPLRDLKEVVADLNLTIYKKIDKNILPSTFLAFFLLSCFLFVMHSLCKPILSSQHNTKYIFELPNLCTKQCDF
ncbi:hypothetical protein RFI_11892 [Reticulomyxa filosa]|uniref:Tify domain-containing protein n=1 Tax=Reticulomyxa filosa TaxID=46433 RepID=X6NH75_RETFI|nr:hypothetical protein RFI_11892 [Reticulomyxa filosa]|eukprot:ETO25248.1 hypothetical protein RFI_11892 [Reticulomyxa filosa]